ncbi:hypothetical protein C8J57DRAFT_1724760 [Mycena rebaudengoi]|nr:hypothetical protein C8J57DRAFT_1724760 [Mycena rebaudengoi]
MLAFEDLGEDVGLRVVSLCDIETLLSLGLVNVFFRRLTMAKQLWILLVEDLASRGLVDLPHSRSLADHSVMDLIGLVKRTVIGPATWSEQEGSPVLAEQISFPDSFRAAEKVELLPGGQYVLVRQGKSGYELWNVKANAPLWTWSSEKSTMHVLEMLDGGRSVVLCLTAMRPHSVAIIQVNLNTGESTQLFETELPDQIWLHQFIHAMLGDLLGYAVYWRTNPTDLTTYDSTYAIMLIDWRAHNYVYIWHPRPLSFSSFTPNLTLAPGHLIFTMTFDEIFVYSAVSFGSRWRALSSMTFDDGSTDITPAIIARLEDFPCVGPPEKLWTPTLMLYRSPLRRDSYKLMIFHSGAIIDKAKQGYNLAPFRVMLNYRFSISPNTGVLERWECTSAIRAGMLIYKRGPVITYAGYCLEFALRNNIVDLRRPASMEEKEAARLILELHKGSHTDPIRSHTQLSGYSSAYLHVRDGNLVVSYNV